MKRKKSEYIYILNAMPAIFATMVLVSSCHYTSVWSGNEEESERPDTTVVKINHVPHDSAETTNDEISPPELHTSDCSCKDISVLDAAGKLKPTGNILAANDEKCDGVVCIEVDAFSTEVSSGSNPPVYDVPVFICAMGTVSKIYINDLPVNFKRDEKTFVKIPMALGDGYNKIPVKIIGTRGKVKYGYLAFKGTEKIDSLVKK